MSVAERTKKHRKNARAIDTMAAVAVARLATGRPSGEAGRSLGKWLQRIAARADFPEDYVELIEEAAAKLGRSR